MANGAETCNANTSSEHCLENHLRAIDLYEKARQRGFPWTGAPWKFCPWCGKPLPPNPKDN